MKRSERSRTSGLPRPCLPRVSRISRDFDDLHTKVVTRRGMSRLPGHEQGRWSAIPTVGWSGQANRKGSQSHDKHTSTQDQSQLQCLHRGCEAVPYAEPSIERWDVDIANPDKTLTVHGGSISMETIQAAVTRAGFQVLGEITATPDAWAADAATADASDRTTYYPLLLLATFLVGLVLLLEFRAGAFVWARAMQNFMGAFFLTFAFFKLLDLRGFAESYRMYDVIAKRLPAYAYIYPFIEFSFGVAYVTGVFPLATNAATLVVMSISSIGVIQSLLAKRTIRCACLGTVFNLPMSTVTLVEDTLMIAMAAAMLFVG